MKIPIKAELVNIGPEGEPRYRLRAKRSKFVEEGIVLERLSSKSGMGKSHCRFMMDSVRDVLYEGVAANETLDFGFMYAKLYPTGTIASLTAQPTKSENPVKVRVFFKGALARKVAALDLFNETQTVNLIIYEVAQDGVKDLNRIESNTARIVMNVNCGKIDSEQEDNGVWLEDPNTGVKVADATISYSDHSVCFFTFPTLPPTGKYRLVIETRNGESPDEYVLARATRNVNVINEEV